MNDISYNNWISMSDNALSQTIGLFIKHHRVDKNRTQDEVAKAANISRSTLSLLEKGESVTITTLLQVLRVLDLLYVMDTFKIEQQTSPIELAKLESKKRQRARKTDKNKKPESDW